MKKCIAMMTILFSICNFQAQAQAQVQAKTITHEISGTTTGINIKNMDGMVDFALVIPGMDQQEIINFNLGKVISPVNDSIKVVSYTVDLPSNLSLPQQTEKYFVSINLNKPEFRAYVEGDGVYNMYALYGKFPLNEMVKGFQNDQSLIELVEYIEFLSGGLKTVPVKGNVSGLSLSANDWPFTESYSVKAPALPIGKSLISFSLLKENNYFYPTDIKKIASGKTLELSTRAGSEHWNLALLMNAPKRSFRETFDGNLLSGMFGSYSLERVISPLAQVSYHFSKAAAVTTPSFLPMIATLRFDKTQWLVQAAAPATIIGVAPYATTLILSEVKAGGTETFPIDFKKALWSSQEMGWQQSFQIPLEAQVLLQSGKDYSWDVIYSGTPQTEVDAQIVWEKISHVTRNSLSF